MRLRSRPSISWKNMFTNHSFWVGWDASIGPITKIWQNINFFFILQYYSESFNIVILSWKVVVFLLPTILWMLVLILSFFGGYFPNWLSLSESWDPNGMIAYIRIKLSTKRSSSLRIIKTGEKMAIYLLSCYC